ncbi:unnamed protein product [Auanema sp. JU1783]|nr:unnamed protein product [Auanema sp. JU1783]
MLFSYIILLFPLIIESKRRLRLSDVCEEYLRCSDELEVFEKTCNRNVQSRVSFVGQHDKTLSMMMEMENSKCHNKLKEEYSSLEDILLKNHQETLMCVRDSVKTNNHFKFGKEKTKFCSPYMVALEYRSISNDNDCRLFAMRMENRCTALRQCCEPAVRCEQASSYSQTGRQIEGLREEISIKLADCRHRDTNFNFLNTKKGNELSDFDNLNDLVPPISYCQRYLDCQKNTLEIRNRCSLLLKTAKSGKLYSWSPMYQNVPRGLDEKDSYCRRKYSAEFNELMAKRVRTDEYLNACVPIANVTREVAEKQQPCQPNELVSLKMDLDEITGETCAFHIGFHKKQCSLLRDCCVQADICERNAMYGVLADDYLLSQTELKMKMDKCYHN